MLPGRIGTFTSAQIVNNEAELQKNPGPTHGLGVGVDVFVVVIVVVVVDAQVASAGVKQNVDELSKCRLFGHVSSRSSILSERCLH
jgi:hypothetical protein